MYDDGWVLFVIIFRSIETTSEFLHLSYSYVYGNKTLLKQASSILIQQDTTVRWFATYTTIKLGPTGPARLLRTHNSFK